MKKLAENVWKLNVDSNVYLINLKESFVIDTGPPQYKDVVKKELGDLEKIKKVIFTHLHYDHTGNFELFPNAEFFASSKEIESFKKNPIGTVLNPLFVLKLKKIKLNPIENIKNFLENIGFEIIETPGHTSGCISLYYKKEKILFSGDTLFYNGFGRTDLPNSDEHEMEKSLKKLQKIKYNILAPGHDY